MPALRQPVKRRRLAWIKLIVAVVFAAAAIFDWTRPPQHQLSVHLYEGAVAGPYRWLIRPMSTLFVRCRYLPTCSQYSVEAVRAHGLPKGLWLTTKRLLRCMPWVPMHTRDPVPAPRDNRSAAGDAHNLAAVAQRIMSMDSSNKDKLKGKLNQAKGSVQEKAGRATGDAETEDRGTANKAGGKVQEKVGDIKKVFGK
ncbi:MAG: membrane protein insertion efficiency factor YidD [Chthoniobacterales bacterium]|nr:membrane protein insertion efficiency factor YidD [Chthoniobacterales bacterium]